MQERSKEYKTQDLRPAPLGTFSFDPMTNVLLATAAGRIVPAMTEAQAQEVANVTAFDTEEDEEGYVALLLDECEAREEYRLLCLYGPYSDF